MTTTPESKDFDLSNEGLRNATQARMVIAKVIEHFYGAEYSIDFLDKTTDEEIAKDFPELNKPEPKPSVHADMLGALMPSFARPGTGFSPSATPYYTPGTTVPQGVLDAQAFVRQAESAGKSFVDVTQAITAGLATAMAVGQATSNIFRQPSRPGGNGGDNGGNGGSDNNDFGKLFERPDPAASPQNFVNFEPDKLSFDWNLGLETTMIGQAPFWKPTPFSSCFYGAIRQLYIPSNDKESLHYFQDTLVPFLRNKINADKKYQAQLGEFFTYSNFQDYMNRFIKACAVYHFFANVYDYTNQDIRINNNAGIRYMRNNLVQTAQLQRLASLKQLLDSMPFPQTLQNSVAQYYGWYSSSESPMAQIYCNVPPVFKVSGSTVAVGESTFLDSFESDIINDQMHLLNYYDKSSSDRQPYYKMIAILNNVIPGYKNSNIGSSYLTDVYDKQHMTMWLNGPAAIRLSSGTAGTGFGIVDIIHPKLTDSTAMTTNVSYFSKTNEPHGYLEGYHSTLTGNATSFAANGYQLPVPLTTTDNFASDHTTVTSNIFCYTERDTNTLRSAGASTYDRGMVLLPSQGEESYLTASPLPISYTQDISVPSNAKVNLELYRPSDCIEITNANLQQYTFNRNTVLQKWIDMQDYSGPLSKGSSGGKRSKFSKARSKDKDEDETMTTS